MTEQRARDLIRHGDLLFRPAEDAPAAPAAGVTYNRLSSKVIQRGEATGHAHTFEGGDATIMERFERRHWQPEPVLTARFLEVRVTVTLKHEEHGPITLAPGLYEIVQAREFDYTAGQGRGVVD